MNKEIELKVKITNYASARRQLLKHAKFVKSVEQVDEYWTPAHKNIYTNGSHQYWRLRQSGGAVSFEYHARATNKRGEKLYAAEYETKVADNKILHKILNFIDARLVLTVKKKREYFKNKDFEFCLDRVSGLGNFLEIENLKVGRNYELALQKCYAQLGQLNIDYQPQQLNYFEQLWPKQKKRKAHQTK